MPIKIKDMSFTMDNRKCHFLAVVAGRILDSSEKMKRQWLVHSKIASRIFCICCRMFQVGDSSSVASSGITQPILVLQMDGS
jgi:hypothetical protein